MRPPLRFADLGCGIGAVLMLVAWRFPAARGVGIEAQAASVDLARRSLAWNSAADRCEVRHGDFREADPGVFDLVTGTPPYLTPGHATMSARAQCGPCHFEERGGVEAYCATAARVLAADGSFVMCAAAFQHARVEAGAAAVGLAVTTHLRVIPRAGKPALFGVYEMRHGDPDRARTSYSELVVRDRMGQWTPAFAAVRAAMGMPAHARPRVD